MATSKAYPIIKKLFDAHEEVGVLNLHSKWPKPYKTGHFSREGKVARETYIFTTKTSLNFSPPVPCDIIKRAGGGGGGIAFYANKLS